MSKPNPLTFGGLGSLQAEKPVQKNGLAALLSRVTTVTSESMKPETEELLYFLLWSVDQMMRPTWRNLNGSFESWAWRNGLGRRLQRLELGEWVELRAEPDLAQVARLTEAGRRRALGGRIPEERWGREWDQRIRAMLFDIPESQRTLRVRLWRWLRSHHFGRLQDSVWITPDAPGAIHQVLREAAIDPGAFFVMEYADGDPASLGRLVASAWNFGAINHRYRRLAQILRDPPPAGGLIAWCRRERAAWAQATAGDPMLPRELCPREYAGPEVWALRREVLARIARQWSGD